MRAPEFWYPRSRNTPWQAVLLTPLSWLYVLAGRLRAAFVQSAKAEVPVICVGNLTVGGVGKTPVVIAILQRLKARSIRAVALTRGYGGRETGPLLVDAMTHGFEDVGDEALLLSAHAPVILARDRAAGARLAVEHGAAMIVMDDGFQNPTLAKTYSLVVVDGESQFGNRLVIPAGPLREPVRAGLARADAAVLMGTNEIPKELENMRVLKARIAAAGPTRPLEGRKLFAFAGIGRPEKFYAAIKTAGAHLAGERSFPDHHPFSEGELTALKSDADRVGATLITTEKDFVRIPPNHRAGILTLPVHVVFDDEGQIERILDQILAGAQRSQQPVKALT
jgi:tetraacyldisaccharide 4'-kinase